MDFASTLKEKYAGIPIWVWALLGTGALSLYMIRRQKKTKTSTQVAANQTSTNLGSASQLSNLFQEAWPMSYMGGDVYINNAVGGAAPGPAPVSVQYPLHGGNPPRGSGSFYIPIPRVPAPGIPMNFGTPYVPLPVESLTASISRVPTAMSMVAHRSQNFIFPQSESVIPRKNVIYSGVAQ